MAHSETHLIHRIGWLRAAVLGANDGIISTASLMMGVAGAASPRPAILLAGVAGMVAGAMSMAAGEYVSVQSQADAEQADIARETAELRDSLPAEEQELTRIYIDRGVEPATARSVALQLMAHDALGTHAREELGISDLTAARPSLAASTSAFAFVAGASAPVGLALIAAQESVIAFVSVGSIILLAVLGALGAYTGGAKIVRAALRVAFWGAAAMGFTAIIGRLAGAQL